MWFLECMKKCIFLQVLLNFEKKTEVEKRVTPELDDHGEIWFVTSYHCQIIGVNDDKRQNGFLILVCAQLQRG
jgi:hypothetical protein